MATLVPVTSAYLHDLTLFLPSFFSHHTRHWQIRNVYTNISTLRHLPTYVVAITHPQCVAPDASAIGLQQSVCIQNCVQNQLQSVQILTNKLANTNKLEGAL